MTVCIAAIYNNNAILGASDRMVTGGYGDITFEPPISKIFQVTNAMAVMTAGDQDLQMQVYQEFFKVIANKIQEDPANWIHLSEAADIYSSCYQKLRNKLIERHVLSHFDLTLDVFIEKQQFMSKEFIDMITHKIERFQSSYMQDIATIITGKDALGPHIYVVRNGEISCHDKLGFASIGIGASHAISHFMLSKYSRGDTESKALLTIHQAKKKSEVSPGVGKETDMCVIGPQLGSFITIDPKPDGLDIVKDLDKIYNKYRKKIDTLDKNTEKTIVKYLLQLGEKSAKKQEVASNIPLLVPTSTSSKKTTQK